jgi:hypothetical protein
MRSHVVPKASVNVSWDFQLADGVNIEGSTGNQIQDIGTQFLSNISTARAMTGFSYGTNGLLYIALGNGTSLAYADTQLTTECAASEGFARSAALTPTYATGTGIGNGYYSNFTITNKFTATVAMTVNCTSVQWLPTAVSNNNMFAEASIGTLPLGQLFNPNDNATFIYTLTIQK